jgi:hypothetical protein
VTRPARAGISRVRLGTFGVFAVAAFGVSLFVRGVVPDATARAVFVLADPRAGAAARLAAWRELPDLRDAEIEQERALAALEGAGGRADPAEAVLRAEIADATGAPAWFRPFVVGSAEWLRSHASAARADRAVLAATVGPQNAPGSGGGIVELERALAQADACRVAFAEAVACASSRIEADALVGDEGSVQDVSDRARRNAERALRWREEIARRLDRARSEARPDAPPPPPPIAPDEVEDAPPPSAGGTGTQPLPIPQLLQLLEKRLSEGQRVRRAARDRRARAEVEQDW